MKNIKPLILLAVLGACAPTVEPTPFYFINGTAPGDPCTSERMLIDTPRGYPRICLNKKWVPVCEADVVSNSPYCKE